MAWAWRPASLVVPTMASSACAASALSSSTPATASRPRSIWSETVATWVPISSSSPRASRAACRLCAARSRTSSATTAKPRPSRPARAASIAALSAIRLVRSAISRMVPMNPLIRVVSAPSSATCSALAETNPLSPTSRSIASPITTRFRLATSAAVPLASAACAPWAAIARVAADSASVERSPPATKRSSSAAALPHAPRHVGQRRAPSRGAIRSPAPAR